VAIVPSYSGASVTWPHYQHTANDGGGQKSAWLVPCFGRGAPFCGAERSTMMFGAAARRIGRRLARPGFYAGSRNDKEISPMTRQVVSSGGPFEQIYGYSRAVRVGAQVHVAGTAARGEALAGDAYVQTQNILGTIRSALEQAGSRVEHVVRTVIYVTDIGDADLVGRAHQEVFGAVRPASTMVQISALIRPEMRVEIEAFAVIDEA
jgi:enamine deaminase RidA (YjgF/YER057c/UK114 family)